MTADLDRIQRAFQNDGEALTVTIDNHPFVVRGSMGWLLLEVLRESEMRNAGVNTMPHANETASTPRGLL